MSSPDLWTVRRDSTSESPEVGSAGRWARHRAHLIAFGAYLGLALLLFRRAWADPMTAWIGTPGDPAQHMWFLHWTPWAIADGRNPLFTDHLNFPEGVNLMWNTLMPLTGIVVSPVTFLVGIVPAYNVVVTGAVALSAWAAYRVLRRYVHPLAAATGGLVFGFSPYVVAHALTHSNLVQVYLLPLFVLFVDELAVRQQRSPRVMGGLLGLTVTAQFYVTEEMLVYEAVAAGLAVLVLAALHPRAARRKARHFGTALAIGTLTASVLMGPALAFQFGGPQRVTSGVLQGPEIRSSDVFSFVVPTGVQQLEPDWAGDLTRRFTDVCCLDEWGSYLGAPLLLLLVGVTVFWWRDDVVKVATVVGFVFAVLSMGPHLHTGGEVTSLPLPFRAFEELPVIGNVQPRRFMVVTWLCIAVLVAVFADAVIRSNRRSLVLGGAALVVLALVPLVPTFDLPASRPSTPAFFTSDAVERIPEGASVLVAPFARDTSTSEPMLWQAEAGMRFKMPEGYILGPDRTGRFVFLPEASELSTAMQEVQRGAPVVQLTTDQRRRYLAELDQRDVEAVVVGPMHHRDEMVEFLTAVLGAPPDRVAGVELWTHVPRPG